MALIEVASDLSEVVEEAIEFVRKNLFDKGEIFVAFSGGKDSIATAEILRMSGLPYRLFHSFSGIDPPEVIRFIRKHYPECTFLHPPQTYWRKLSVSVPPSGHLRWCCELLRKLPSWNLPYSHRVLGIRWEESPRRSKYPRINHKAKLGHYEYYPIVKWLEWHVWEFISAQKLPYPLLYDEGFGRVGCIVCPFHSEWTGKVHEQYRERWPKHFVLFEKTIRELFAKGISQGKKMFYDTPEEFLHNWYLNDCTRWYAREESEDNIRKKGLVL